jgi:hypothetical protein
MLLTNSWATTASRRSILLDKNADNSAADTVLITTMETKLSTRNQRVRLNGRDGGASALLPELSWSEALSFMAFSRCFILTLPERRVPAPRLGISPGTGAYPPLRRPQKILPGTEFGKSWPQAGAFVHGQLSGMQFACLIADHGKPGQCAEFHGRVGGRRFSARRVE